MSKKHSMAGFEGPDVKRRKTEPNEFEDGWDADDDFSQAELENIDNIILSQRPTGTVEQNNNGGVVKNNNGNQKPSTSKPRVIGRGSVRSHSANEVYTSPSAQVPQRKLLTKTQVPFLSNNMTKTLQTKYEQSKANGGRAGSSMQTSMHLHKSQANKKPDNRMDVLNKEIQRLKAVTYTAEGKVKILEQNMTKKDQEINKLRQEKILHSEQEAQERSEKEKRFERDNEKLRTELEFKQQEVLELQRHLRQERSSHGGGGDCQSPKLRSPQPNRKLPHSPATPKGRFPTKQTFLADGRSPEKSKPKEKPCTASKPSKQRRMKLTCRQADVSLRTSGPQLVSKLMGESGVSSNTPSPEGLFRLLQATSHSPDDNTEQHEASSVSKRKQTNQATKSQVDSQANQEHHSLAMQAISTLLTSSSLENSDSVILLLPLLESHIVRYVDSFRNPSSSKDLSTSTGSSSSHKMESPNRSSSIDSDLSSAFNSALTLDLEHRALDSLYRLNVLVRHSSEVQNALIAMAGGSTVTTDPTVTPGLKSSSLSQKDSRPASSSRGPSRSTTPLPATCRSRIIHHSNLYSVLLRLADPQTQQTVRRGACKVWPVCVSAASVQVLTTLAQLLDRSDQLHIFEPLFSPALSNCLEDVSMERLPLLAYTLDLLTALVKSEKLFKLLCANSGECLLMSAYHCIIHIPSSCPNDQRRSLKYKLLLLLCNIVKEYGTDALLSDCECGQEVVKCLVLMLYNELPLHHTKPFSSSSATSSSTSSAATTTTLAVTAPSLQTTHSTTPTSTSSSSSSSTTTTRSRSRSLLSVLEVGVELLHALSVGGGDNKTFRRRRGEVDHCYIHLMFAYEELVDAANTDETDPIGSMISDLWDFEHPLPWEIWLDDEEDQAMDQN